MRLLEAIAARAGVANKLAADRRRIDANLPRDVGLRVAALQERVNLAALFAGQMEMTLVAEYLSGQKLSLSSTLFGHRHRTK